ncbi:hypothetical protein [Aurantiacibacter suaedae]|uniref:hypothetical protein n=1 Tax=Aurantiacibacter suaedae TaxID=2545755 RepID=UPI0010F847FF|nr:hypothetical protein [Aurantiacibacter suaedae]
MTAIAIWRNDEVEGNPSLWAAADSRVSGVNGHLLIEDAVKIFSLPVICRRPGPNGFFSETYFVHTLGYCFAGSTLMGQNTYLGLVPLLSNLLSATSYIPSIEDIAGQIFAYLKVTFGDYRPIGAQQSLFEVAIFGYCHRTHQLEIYQIRPELVEDVYEVTLKAHQNLQPHHFLYLGDDGATLRNEISNAFNCGSRPGHPISRAPRFVIQDRIANDESPTIGGDLQLSIADRFGLRPLAMVKPRVPGQPAAYVSYLGRELAEDLTTVGEARASLDAIV